MTTGRRWVEHVRLHLRRHRLRVTVIGAGLAGIAVLVPAAASATTSPSPASVVAGRWAGGGGYLALGDSVTFGYREPTTSPPPNYYDAASFVGYPEVIGAALGLSVVNPACPGETSASLINAAAPSNGCESVPGGGPGYRSAYPLHVSYSGSQLEFAIQYLRTHPRTQLVSLMIGANDAFLCQETTADHCANKAEIDAVMAHISANVAQILKAIRTLARYHGRIVILNYYSLDYANAADDLGSLELNTAMDQGARPFGVTVADGYGVLEAAAQQSGGNTCTAGLLTQLPHAQCGIHPSLAGQSLLALAVEEATHQRW